MPWYVVESIYERNCAMACSNCQSKVQTQDAGHYMRSKQNLDKANAHDSHCHFNYSLTPQLIRSHFNYGSQVRVNNE